MKLLRNILAVSPYLNLALVISIVSVVVIEAYLLEIPEIVSWGAEFGAVYYKLCLSIMASYIFYFIVVHLKVQADKENINAFVATKAYGVVRNYKAQLQALKKAAAFTADTEYLTKEEVEQVFKAINPLDNAPLLLRQLGNHANWLQYMKYHNDRTQELIKKTFVKMPFLDSKLVRLLAEIDDCSHFNTIDFFVNTHLRNKDMSAWAGHFFEYSIKCKELQEYNEKRLSQYKS